jgi:hypothetical protein
MLRRMGRIPNEWHVIKPKEVCMSDLDGGIEGWNPRPPDVEEGFDEDTMAEYLRDAIWRHMYEDEGQAMVEAVGLL